MKMTILCASTFLVALSSGVFAVSVDRNITTGYVKSNPNEFSVSVTEGGNGLLAFAVVYTTSEARYVVSHLAVKDSKRTYAENRTASFTKNHSNTFHFSVPRDFVETSTFSLSVSGFANFDGEAVPLPGTIKNKLQLLDFVPKKLRN